MPKGRRLVGRLHSARTQVAAGEAERPPVAAPLYKQRWASFSPHDLMCPFVQRLNEWALDTKRFDVARKRGMMTAMRKASLWVGVTCAMTIFVACGGDSSSSGSGIDRSKRVASLSSDEAKKLCDYLNNKQGGYGKSQTCQDGTTETTDDSQNECVLGAAAIGLLSGCSSITVGQSEDCVDAIGAKLCDLRTNAACKPQRDCLATLPK